MNRTCSVFLFLFYTVVVAGRKLHESPDKCAGPFDLSNTTLYRTDGIGAGRGCDTFPAKELPMDEALGLIVRLGSPLTSNASLFDLRKEAIGATLAPSKACLLENWFGNKGNPIRSALENILDTIFGPSIADNAKACFPGKRGCRVPPGRRRRQLMMVTTQGGDLEEGEGAPGPASDGLETGEVGDGEAAFTACNGRCCVSLFVKEKDLDAVLEASAN